MSNPFVRRLAYLGRRAVQGSQSFARAGVLIWISSIAWAGMVTAQIAMSLPHGPAPRFFIVSGLDADTIELTEVDTVADDMIVSTVYRPRIADIEMFDAAGNALDARTFRSRIHIGIVVLVAADEHPIDPIYLSIVEDDTIVLMGVVVRVEVE